MNKLHLLSSVTFFAGFALSVSTPAQAACDATITCTGVETNPISDARDNLTVTVEPGAVVEVATDDAITLEGNDNTIDNSGRIEATGGGDEAVKYSGDRLTVFNRNDAKIASADKGLERDGGQGLDLTNEGEIIAVDDAVRDDEGDVVVVNEADGVIKSTEDKGLRLRGSNTDVTNRGMIMAEGEAVEGRDGFSLTNEAGASIISATDDAVQFGDGTLNNSGDIIGGDDGLDVDSGVVTNAVGGLISSSSNADDAAAIDVDPVGEDDMPAATLVLSNLGTIRGVVGINHDPASIAAQDFFNGGIIEGTGGTAIQFAQGQGGSSLTLSGASQIIGDVFFGDSSDLLTVEDITSGVLINSAFDGGLGEDNVDMSEYKMADVINIIYTPKKMISFDILASNGDYLTGNFKNFEFFTFEEGRVSIYELAQVPLPGGLVLLGGALAGFATVGRKRKG